MTIGIGGTKGEAVVVVVNFEKYPIKCHFCGRLTHLIKECQTFRARKYTTKCVEHALGGSRKDEKGNKVDQEMKKMEVSRVQIGKGFEKEGEVVQLPHNSKLKPHEDDKMFIEDIKKRNKNKDRSVVIENKGKEKVNTPMKFQGSKIFVVKNAPNLVVEKEVGDMPKTSRPKLVHPRAT